MAKLNKGNNIGLWVGLTLIVLGLIVAFASGQPIGLLYLVG